MLRQTPWCYDVDRVKRALAAGGLKAAIARAEAADRERALDREAFEQTLKEIDKDRAEIRRRAEAAEAKLAEAEKSAALWESRSKTLTAECNREYQRAKHAAAMLAEIEEDRDCCDLILNRVCEAIGYKPNEARPAMVHLAVAAKLSAAESQRDAARRLLAELVATCTSRFGEGCVRMPDSDIVERARAFLSAATDTPTSGKGEG
jgi:chromosome segregation ATPase